MKFPGYAFNPLHGMTLRDRVAKLCEYSLRRRLPSFRVNVTASTQDYVYRSMVSADSIQMGVYSLASLARCAKAMPRIELCVDESLGAREVESIFARHGLKVDVLTVDDLDAELAKRGQEVLRRFAKAFFWGRKTAFTFGLGDEVPVLYADLDVLWRKDPCEAMNLRHVFTILATTDRGRSYDDRFLGMMHSVDKELVDRSPVVCAGLYAVGAGFQLPADVVTRIGAYLDDGVPGYFAEQTVLGVATHKVGRLLPFDVLPSVPKEETICSPSWRGKPWIAAHYAGPSRPQFWRDAWALFRG